MSRALPFPILTGMRRPPLKQIAVIFCAFLLGFAGAGSPAVAGQCGYAYCWGALSVGDAGAAGRATGHRTAPGAAEAALRACGAGCQGFEVFVNSCAAFAEDATGARSFGWAEAGRDAAETRALAACRLGGKGCRIRIWACSR